MAGHDTKELTISSVIPMAGHDTKEFYKLFDYTSGIGKLNYLKR
jgi:hypothetical protein